VQDGEDFLAIRHHGRDALLAGRNISGKEASKYSFCFSSRTAVTKSHSVPMTILAIDGPEVVFVSRQFNGSKLLVVFL
jgi:hypothetical protein